MKKMILSAMAICAFAFTTNAQDVTFGAKAGLNLANQGGDIKNNSMKIGFQVGGVAEIMFSDKFGVQPELLYSTQGTKTESSDSGSGWSDKDESTYKLDYLALPIMGKYFISDEFSVLAGPQISFLMNSKDEWENSYTVAGTTTNTSGTIDNKKNTSSMDFGLNFGAEYKMESGLNFSARYNLGLSNTYDGPGDYKSNNSVIQFSVGYFFN